MARTVNTVTDPHALADSAVELVRTWLQRAQENQRNNKQKNPAEDRLAAVLQDPNGLEFTVGFVDRVIRTEDTKAAAKALQDIAKLTPQSMPVADRAQIQAGTVLSGALPSVCLLYTSPSPRDLSTSRMPSSA